MTLRSALSSFQDDLPFYLAKLKQYRKREVTPGLTEHSEHLRTLLNDGVVVIENFLTPGQIGAIQEELASRTDFLGARQGPNIVRRNARYLLLEPEALPSTRVFYQSPLISGLARAYLSPHAVVARPAVQLKVDVGEASYVDYYHIDEWRCLISAFAYLTDVGPEQAPLVYMRGSHKKRLWKLEKEKEFFKYYGKKADGTYINEESPYCGCVLPTEARRLRERYGFDQFVCTGSAGTLVLFDNLGLHRASVLQSGSRLLLSSYWTLPQT
jgi:hypothetical protein